MITLKKQNERVEIGPLEQKLFVYLYEYKVALCTQIQRDIFTNHGLRGVQHRLCKLNRFHYVKRNFCDGLRTKVVYHLGLEAFNKYIKPLGGNVKRELGSRAIHHDLDLLDISYAMKQSSRVKNYYPENLISTEGLVSFDPDRFFIDDIRPDAVVEIEGKDRTFCAALEYERATKYNHRYKDLITRYYNKRSIPGVLYICQDEALLNYVRNIEKSIVGTNTPKFYYSDFSKWSTGESKVFTNLRESRITL